MIEHFISQQQAICATLAAEREVLHLMPKDADGAITEQLGQLLDPLSKFTDALCSETQVTLSTIKLVLDHITGDVLEDNAEDLSLTKQMKQAMRDDLNNRYTDKAKVMQMACFMDPRFKTNFLDAPVDDIVSSCVQEALMLTPVQVRQEEPESTSSTSTTAGGKGLAGLLKKITSTRQQ